MTHEDVCRKLTELYKAKNADYGNAYTLLREEFPASICYRLTDKLNRLKTLYRGGGKVKNESIDDTLMDIANYAIMELIERDKNEC